MKLKRIFALVLTAVMLSLLVSAPAMAAAVGKLTTTGSVNLRKGPGLDREVITSVRKDTELDYKGASVYDSRGILWHKVSYKKSSAWVSAKYSYVTVSGKKLDNKVYVISTGSVNLRKGPGTGYARIFALPKGTKLTYLGKTSTDSRGRKWYNVSYNGTAGWVSSRYSVLKNK